LSGRDLLRIEEIEDLVDLGGLEEGISLLRGRGRGVFSTFLFRGGAGALHVGG